MAVFTNQATLTYNNNVINSNIATGEIQEVLEITKTAVLDTYTQGDEVTYVINIRNSGTLDYNGLTLTDDLGAYTLSPTVNPVPLTLANNTVTYFINGVPQAAPTVTVGPPLTITGLNIPADGVATIIYTTRVNQFAPLDVGGTVNNTATLSGGGITPITATEAITASDAANLTITKTISPTVVQENGRVTYTFLIQNTGNAPVELTDNAIITDTFDPILSDLVVTFNGATWTAPTNYTYTAGTGLFTTNAGQITVPAATYTQDPLTGVFVIQPGVSTLTVTGTV